MPRRPGYDRATGYDSDHSRRERPGRGSRYDLGYRGARGYDAPLGGPYDPSLGRHPGPLGEPPYVPFAGPTPFIPFGWDPMMRWGGWGPGVGYVPYADEPPTRRPVRRTPPEQSPTYGRRGDEEARHWAERHGYRVERTIRPRRRGYDG
jgi:hypothetical protein